MSRIFCFRVDALILHIIPQKTSMHKIFVTDSFGEDHILEYRKHEFRNLMELLVDRLYDDIGECRGRALCGTCHIRVWTNGEKLGKKDLLEKQTLGDQYEIFENSRLACQILLDGDLDGTKIQIIGGD